MKRAWARLRQHWIRHLLAALQVAVGVAVVTAIFIDVVPLIRQGAGDRQTEVFYGYYGAQSSFGGFRSNIFQLEDLHFIENEIHTIEAVSIYDGQSMTLVNVDDELFLVRNMAKVSPGFANVVDLEMTAGRFFTDEDTAVEEAQVAVISERLAEFLFSGEEVIGQTINIRPREEANRVMGFAGIGTPSTEGVPGLDVTIVGVFASPSDQPAYAGLLSGTIDSELMIPATGTLAPSLMATQRIVTVTLTESLSSLPPDRSINETYDNLYFRAHEGMGEQALAEVNMLLGSRLNERRGDEGRDLGDGMIASLTLEPIQSGDQMARQMQMQSVLMLGALGVAALIVAGFSVFTTFLASVAERIRSIGLSRSLGATRGRVVREVMGEAVLLTGVGGIGGVLLSLPIRSQLTRSFLTLDTTVSFTDFIITAVIAILVAVAIGAIAAVYPGWTVARLMPAEAFDEQ